MSQVKGGGFPPGGWVGNVGGKDVSQLEPVECRGFFTLVLGDSDGISFM